MHIMKWLYAAVLFIVVLAAPAMASAGVRVSPIGQRLYLMQTDTDKLRGNMNNLVMVGCDGVLLVDTADPGTYASFRAGLDQITSDPVDLLINTHWHPDHVGLNGDFVRYEGTPTILAGRQTGRFLSEERRIEDVGAVIPPLPPAARPTELLNWGKFLFHNGESVLLVTMRGAHAGEDLVVYFPKSNVLYAGDLYFGGMFPFIDRTSGGSIEGVIRAGRVLLAMMNSSTRIVPSHGEVGGRQELLGYLEMLEDVRDRIGALIARGQDERTVVASHPLADLNARWGWYFVNDDLFTTIVYRSLTQSG